MYIFHLALIKPSFLTVFVMPHYNIGLHYGELPVHCNERVRLGASFLIIFASATQCYMSLPVCLSVCHKTVLYRNGSETIVSSSKGNSWIYKIRLLFSRNLPKLSTWNNFATARRPCKFITLIIYLCVQCVTYRVARSVCVSRYFLVRIFGQTLSSPA